MGEVKQGKRKREAGRQNVSQGIFWGLLVFKMRVLTDERLMCLEDASPLASFLPVYPHGF